MRHGSALADGPSPAVARCAGVEDGLRAAARRCGASLTSRPAAVCGTAEPNRGRQHGGALRPARDAHAGGSRGVANGPPAGPRAAGARQGAGLGRALEGRRSRRRHLARGGGPPAGPAQGRDATAAGRPPALRRLRDVGSRRSRPRVHVAGPDLRARGSRRRLVALGAGARRGRRPPRRHRAQHLRLPPDAGRLDPRRRCARAGLRRHRGRPRQHRAAARRHRAPERLSTRACPTT